MPLLPSKVPQARPGAVLRQCAPLAFHVFAALAEFIRELIVEGTREGLGPPAPAACASDGRRP